MPTNFPRQGEDKKVSAVSLSTGEKLMERYCKKPVVIEAIQFTDESYREIAQIEGVIVHLNGEYGDADRKGLPAFASIETLEGTMTASVGDWIVRGVKGELYPCKPDIFEMTYEQVKE